MAFCKNCGQKLEDSFKVCPNCGAPVAAQEPAQQPAPDAQQNKGIAWLAYFGLFLLIPLFARKASEFCKFHVKQGVILFVLDICYTIVTAILRAIINAIFPGTSYYFWYVPSTVYSVFSTIFNLGQIFFLVMIIFGVINVVKGEKKELPVIGKIPFLNPLMDKIYAALNK